MDVRAAAPPSFIGRHFFVEVPAPSPRAVRAREEYRRRQLDELQRVDTDSEPSSGSPEQQEDERSSEDDAEEVEELLRGPSRASAEAGQGREPEGEEDQDATEAPEEDGEDGAPSDVDMEGNASAQDNVPAATTSGELLQEEALHPVMHNGATPTVSSRPADATAGGSDIQHAMQLDPGVPSDGAAAGPLSAAAESILTSTSTLDATDAVPDVRVDTAATPEDPAGLASEQSAAVTHASIDGEHPAGKATPHQQLEATPSAEMTKSRSRSAGASSVASSSKKGGARGGSADGPDRIQSRLEPPGGQRKRLVRTGAVPASSSASPAAEAVSARGSPATASARSSSAYEILEKLPMDTGISKILNRDLNADGVYEYIVKLDNGSRVKVGAIPDPLFGRLLLISLTVYAADSCSLRSTTTFSTSSLTSSMTTTTLFAKARSIATVSFWTALMPRWTEAMIRDAGGREESARTRTETRSMARLVLQGLLQASRTKQRTTRRTEIRTAQATG